MTHLSRRTLLASPLAVLAGCSTAPEPPAPFPDVAAAGLTDRQRRFLAVVREHYATQPPASTFTPVAEPWCADYVSWVQRAIGAPMTNPNGGGWRIPGTMTLLDHLRATRVWHEPGSGYVPVTGDIAIYDGPRSPFGQHTNYVLTCTDDTLTTLGGNEGARNVTISSHPRTGIGCLGFGHRA